MITRTNSFKASENLSNAIALRAKQLGHPSQASYIKALIRADIDKGDGIHMLPDHQLLKTLTLSEQDTLDKILLTKLQNL